jgi:hypothetical protein
MAIALPTAEHLLTLETEAIATAVGQAWIDPATGLPRTEAAIGSSIRTRFNALRSRLGYNLVISPDPAPAIAAPFGIRAIDIPA